VTGKQRLLPPATASPGVDSLSKYLSAFGGCSNHCEQTHGFPLSLVERGILTGESDKYFDVCEAKVLSNLGLPGAALFGDA
jgi:hypothetical protein